MKWLRRVLGLSQIQQDVSEIKKIMLMFQSLNEHDPIRKALSDALGSREIARLKAEDAARRYAIGEDR